MNEHIIFVDTSAYLAASHHNDQDHKKSVEIWNEIKSEKMLIYTSTHVIDELATLLARRTDYVFAADEIDLIHNSDMIIEDTNENDRKEALKLFKKYADQKISFTDCFSFVVMSRLKIKKVFTFDSHFSYVGFDVIPPLY